MNAWFILFLKIWGISAVITVLGLFLDSRLKRANGTKSVKATIEDYVGYSFWGPFSAIIVVFCFVIYLFEWAGYFWERIKDIEI